MHSKITLIARILLGLNFLIFGLNGFFQFLPMPPMTEAAGAFMTALAQTGYFFILLKTCEVLCGIALLTNQFVPLALTVLAPIVVNIFAVHVFLDRGGLPLAIVISVLGLYLAWAHRSAYKGILTRKFQNWDTHSSTWSSGYSDRKAG